MIEPQNDEFERGYKQIALEDFADVSSDGGSFTSGELPAPRLVLTCRTLYTLVLVYRALLLYLSTTLATVICVSHHLWAVRLTIIHWRTVRLNIFHWAAKFVDFRHIFLLALYLAVM